MNKPMTKLFLRLETRQARQDINARALEKSTPTAKESSRKDPDSIARLCSTHLFTMPPLEVMSVQHVVVRCPKGSIIICRDRRVHRLW